MKIRKMVIEDYEKVYQLWMSCAGMGLNNLDDSKEGIEKFLRRNPDTCFVAEDQEIVGVILAGNDGRRGYIYHTAVHPDYRKQGIAASLVEHVEKAMVELEIHKVALVVFDRHGLCCAFFTASFILYHIFKESHCLWIVCKILRFHILVKLPQLCYCEN